MAQMDNILVKDDTNTSKTLIPANSANQTLMWRSNISAVPAKGQIRLTAVWEMLKNGTWRGSVKTEVPTMESVGSSAASGYVAAPEVAYTCVAITTLFAPERSTNVDRANIMRMHIHALTGASAAAAAEVDAAAGASGVFAGVSNTSAITYLLVNQIPPT